MNTTINNTHQVRKISNERMTGEIVERTPRPSLINAKDKIAKIATSNRYKPRRREVINKGEF